MAGTDKDVKVWDLFVRIGHWTLAVAFFVAYLTQEDAEDVHVAAGYYVAGYLIARTIWGFVGSKHARFSDFIYGPQRVVEYLGGLLRGHPPRYLGHNPAGGIMIIAMLLGLAGTVFTGLAVEADSENEGPLAAWLGHPGAAPAMPTVDRSATPPEAGEEGERGEKPESAYEEAHEVFANFTLVLVILHVLGVIISSFVHKENLPRAMITGRKPPLAPEARP